MRRRVIGTLKCLATESTLWFLIQPGTVKKAHHKGELLSFGAPSRIRIHNLLIRSQMLYPVELWAHRLKTKVNITDSFLKCKHFFYALR